MSLNKPAILAALSGPHKAKLRGLCLRQDDGEERFYVKRVEQTGTMGGS